MPKQENQNIGCLSISRKQGEWTKIGEVMVQVAKVKGKKVQLVIKADRSIPIERIDGGE